jgi:hypothetical protein
VECRIGVRAGKKSCVHQGWAFVEPRFLEVTLDVGVCGLGKQPVPEIQRKLGRLGHHCLGLQKMARQPLPLDALFDLRSSAKLQFGLIAPTN